MLMKHRLLLLAVALFFITSCSRTNDNNVVPTATNDTPHKVAGKSAKTLTGSLHFSSTNSFDLQCNCGSVGSVPGGNFLGTGTLTHLGLSTSKINPCIYPIDGGSGFHVLLECNTLIAANGDELTCHILPYDIIWSGSDLIGTAEIDIIGGTGRFAGATGHFSGITNVHFFIGTADMTGINGTINY